MRSNPKKRRGRKRQRKKIQRRIERAIDAWLEYIGGLPPPESIDLIMDRLAERWNRPITVYFARVNDPEENTP